METTLATPDIMTITCERPAQSQKIVVTIPAELVGMLQWLADNSRMPDPANPGQTLQKYLHAPNVIYRDVITYLLPMWQRSYMEGQTAALTEQIKQVQDAVSTLAGAALSSLRVDEIPPMESPAE